MDKAILVMDMPDNCFYCFCMESCEKLRKKNGIDIRNGLNDRPDCCPLKDLPEKKKYHDGTFNGVVNGWNLCIDEI